MPSLPSVNLLDGKAKQFDDGLYAAIDQAYFQGVADKLQSHQQLVQRLLDKVGPDSPAAPYLAAGLTLGGKETPAANKPARDSWIAKFNSNPALSKPIGFYTWNGHAQEVLGLHAVLPAGALDSASPRGRRARGRAGRRLGPQSRLRSRPPSSTAS